jgi:hypothetical protein
MLFTVQWAPVDHMMKLFRCLRIYEVEPQSDMLKVYAHFGDVRYEGDRYRAFCAWWRNRVDTNEERGVYLSAEPLRGRWTHLVEDGARAAEYAANDDWLMIAIPLPQQRRYVDKSTNRLLKKHLPTERGKAVVNPAEPGHKRVADEAVDANVQKNTISTLVSRELRLAHEMITHAGVGVFP